MHCGAILDSCVNRYVLGIRLIIIVVPPHDHVAGLKAVFIDDVDPFIVLNALLAVSLKTRKAVLRRLNISLLKNAVSKTGLDSSKSRSLKSVFIRRSAT